MNINQSDSNSKFYGTAIPKSLAYFSVSINFFRFRSSLFKCF